MINIDTVYQKVLVLANKEQRGYITPQEYNLLADQAQNEIFDSYFHSMKTAYSHPVKTDVSSFDDMTMIEHLIHPFRNEVKITFTEGDSEYNSAAAFRDGYLESINLITVGASEADEIMHNPIEEVKKSEISSIMSHPLTMPTETRMVFHRHLRAQFVNLGTTSNNAGSIKVYPTPTSSTKGMRISYFSRPKTPNWGYVVVKGKALYNSNDTYSQNFELHESEEETLVMRILALAGIVIMKPGIVEIGLSDSARKKQEENS